MQDLDAAKINAALPPLYGIADKRAIAAQTRHFSLVILEYLVLVSTATVTLMAGIWEQIPPEAYTASFVLLVLIATLSHFAGQDKSWFKARAAAEATKTMAWRFMMRAPPYKGGNSAELFLSRADGIAELDGVIAKRSKDPITKQITPLMQTVRDLDIAARAALYTQARVEDQRDWYKRKTKINSGKSLRWYLSAVAIYAIPIALLWMEQLDGEAHWPIISLFLLVGSSLLGWTKAKRFRELATSYEQAAKEIETILEDNATITSEQQLSDFVFAAESAFSREHTAWIISKK